MLICYIFPPASSCQPIMTIIIANYISCLIMCDIDYCNALFFLFLRRLLMIQECRGQLQPVFYKIQVF